MRGRGGDGREGREWGKKGRGCPVFSLSRPVNPKHKQCLVIFILVR